MPRYRRSPEQTIDYDDDDNDNCCRHGDNKLGQRNAANARERARMRILSKAFSRLKTTLPWVPADTKLSKLDTLRLATSYIAHLRTILTDDGNPPPIVHPLNLTWPFTIQQPTSDNTSSRNPEDWSMMEENQNTNRSTLININSTRESPTPCSEPDLENTQRHYQTKNHHYSDRRHHYSDSLLNLG
ncbi:Neurogenic differentiation factor, putative [Pediculus humanus corporis]|uniref:Neurogenic differentiation factor, putative n=1 Tax=Pediculus humanus subsp. corporis TaxID=121224 RepID=E0VLU9_PEDHC|nr:Neurogenic differentiation factor, putative [Pediculus humanus corporis]EEB14355.1 Neurogenic differentiation factor, putative [Pediculus humanus corporis]